MSPEKILVTNAKDSQGAEDVTEKYSLWAFLGILGDKLHDFLYVKSSCSGAVGREKKNCQDLTSYLKVIFLNAGASEELIQHCHTTTCRKT